MIHFSACLFTGWFARSINIILLSTTIVFMFSNPVQSQQGLKADYYDGTNFDRFVTTKYVDNIDQSWYNIPPVSGIDPHECSIRWTGKIKPGISGTYTFSAQVDDGIRVWVNNKLIIDQWDLNDLGVFEGTLVLEAGTAYAIKVEYFNGLLEGEIRLLWKKHKEELSWYERLFGDGISFSVIPKDVFLQPVAPIQVSREKSIEAKKKVEKTKVKKKPTAKLMVKKSPPKENQKNRIAEKPKELSKPEPEKPRMNVEMAKKYIPKNVEFERGKTIILESSYKELNAFANFLADNLDFRVMIEGHTDPVGDTQLNLELSEHRATTIAEYLIEKGVDKKRIKSEGFGGTRPLVVPEKGKFHPANRRVVFILE